MARADNGARTDSAQAGTFPEQPCRLCGCPLNSGNTYVSNKGVCKECIKQRVKDSRAKKADYYLAYDRKRYRESLERQASARRSAASPAGVLARAKSAERTRKKHPEKIAARSAVLYALRCGNLEKQPCYFCGSSDRLHAHHPDYAKALEVFWLCAPCHGKLHTINGDLLRAPRNAASDAKRGRS